MQYKLPKSLKKTPHNRQLSQSIFFELHSFPGNKQNTKNKNPIMRATCTVKIALFLYSNLLARREFHDNEAEPV